MQLPGSAIQLARVTEVNQEAVINSTEIQSMQSPVYHTHGPVQAWHVFVPHSEGRKGLWVFVPEDQ